MHYTIYKITNKLNDKYYIGKHQTKNLNDGYMGSGKLICRDIGIYGSGNFQKEILHIFDNEQDMNNKESELVSEFFVARDDTYNLCPGGKGGWGFNNTKDGQKLREHSYKKWSAAGNKRFLERYESDKDFFVAHNEHLKNISHLGRQKALDNHPNGTFYGKSHSEETKQKMRKPKNQGIKNSQFGTIWITNGKDSMRIKKDVDVIPLGWFKGRVVKR